MDLCKWLCLLELKFLYCKRRLIISQCPAHSVNGSYHHHHYYSLNKDLLYVFYGPKKHGRHWQSKNKYTMPVQEKPVVQCGRQQSAQHGCCSQYMYRKHCKQGKLAESCRSVVRLTTFWFLTLPFPVPSQPWEGRPRCPQLKWQLWIIVPGQFSLSTPGLLQDCALPSQKRHPLGWMRSIRSACSVHKCFIQVWKVTGWRSSGGLFDCFFFSNVSFLSF